MRRHGAVVVKPIHGNGGKAIFRVPRAATTSRRLIDVFNQTWPEPHMVQPFLPEVAEGDKRIVLVDGEYAGRDQPQAGRGRVPLKPRAGRLCRRRTDLTAREEEICAAMGPRLKKRGLIFVGIDVIGGKWLTEINVTSPTGIVSIDQFNGTDTAARIWDAIEATAFSLNQSSDRSPSVTLQCTGLIIEAIAARRIPRHLLADGPGERISADSVRGDHGHRRRARSRVAT